MKKIFFAMIAMLVMIGSVMAVSYSDLAIHKVADTTINYNVDIAVDSSDNVHRVYERDNSIYYSLGDSNEEFVADGINPAIAVGLDNKPQIVFENNDQVYYAHKVGSNWQFSIFNGHNADISVDSNNMPYIVYITGGNVILSTLVGQGFSDKTLFTGSYHAPIIKMDANDKYHVVASDGKNTIYTSNANGGQDASGPLRSYTKNALTIDSSNVAHLVYGDGSVYYVTPMDNWNEVLMTDKGSKSAIDTRDGIIGIAYTYDGNIYYTEDKGAGFSEAKIVDSGNNPVIGVGSAFIDYIKDDMVYEAYVPTGGSVNDDIIPLITPSIVTGTVTYNGTAVDSASVEVICNNVSATTTTNLFGDYYVTFTSDNCRFGDLVDVSASKDSLNGHNTGSMCNGEECEIPVGLVDVDVQVPEFGVIGATFVLLAGIGIVFYRRK